MRFFDGFANIHLSFVHAPVLIPTARRPWSGSDGEFGQAALNWPFKVGRNDPALARLQDKLDQESVLAANLCVQSALAAINGSNWSGTPQTGPLKAQGFLNVPRPTYGSNRGQVMGIVTAAAGALANPCPPPVGLREG
jgi:hypothetical protein